MSLIIPGGASHVPHEIQDRLKEIDPRLYLVPKQRAVFDCGAESDRPEFQWVWYLALRWPEQDPRRRMVQVGQIDPENAFDMLGQVPADCSLEQVPGYLVRQLKVVNNVPRHVCEQVVLWNQDQELRNAAPTVELAEELFEANKHTLFPGNAPTRPVYQNNPTPKRSKKAKEAE